MVRQNRKNYLTHLVCHSTLAFGFQRKWRPGKPRKIPFFIISESENRTEKSCFHQELWLFENGLKTFYESFECLHKKCRRQQNYGNLRTNRYIFSKPLKKANKNNWIHIALNQEVPKLICRLLI